MHKFKIHKCSEALCLDMIRGAVFLRFTPASDVIFTAFDNEGQFGQREIKTLRLQTETTVKYIFHVYM